MPVYSVLRKNIIKFFYLGLVEPLPLTATLYPQNLTQQTDSAPLIEDRMPLKMRKRRNRQLRLHRKEEPSQRPAARTTSLPNAESVDIYDVPFEFSATTPPPSTSSNLPDLHLFGALLLSDTLLPNASLPLQPRKTSPSTH